MCGAQGRSSIKRAVRRYNESARLLEGDAFTKALSSNNCTRAFHGLKTPLCGFLFVTLFVSLFRSEKKLDTCVIL